MPTFDLALRPSSGASGPAAGWLLPGGSASGWLEEILTWEDRGRRVVLHPIPAASNGRRAGSALAIAAGPVRPTPRAIACSLLAGKLYLPSSARLEVGVWDEELAEALPGALYLLHPALGLVELAPQNALRMIDLIRPPALRATAWDGAVRGLDGPARRRLLSVVPEPSQAASTVEEVLRGGREEIGGRPPRELPPAPAESGGKGGLPEPIEQARKAGRGLLKALDWLAGQAPRRSGGPTWIDGVQKWARDRMEELREARERELERLLGMLRRDPEQGLRYAIPVGDGGAGRGRAAPSSRLGRHGIDFNLLAVGGGRPSDSWQTSYEIRQALIQEYRKAATSAMASGRHRRAAYILAELLGDYPAAADALRQGGHHREAAVLYRDYLSNPREAARCLEEGGLLPDAVALYESLGDHASVGRIYDRLERREEAREAYRKAAWQLVGDGDRIGAAFLLERKADDPDQALEVLEAGWPASQQAAGCLLARFRLLGRLGRHEASLALVRELDTPHQPPGRVADAAATLVKVAGKYPDRGVRARAADMTRVILGRRLAHAGPEETGQLLRSLAELAPGDRLLARDVTRYAASRRAGRLRLAPELPERVAGPELVAEIRLPDLAGGLWTAAETSGETFLVAGYDGAGGLVLVRGTWDGLLTRQRWPAPLRAHPGSGPVPPGAGALLQPQASSLKPSGGQPSVLLGAPRYPAHPVVVALRNGAPLAIHRLPPTSFRETDRLCEAGTPSWLPGDAAALCYNENDVLWVLRGDPASSPVLAAYTTAGEPIFTRELSGDGRPLEQLELATAIALETPILARHGHIFVAAWSTLHQMFHRDAVQSIPLPSPARSLVASGPFTRLRLAVTLEDGGLVFWPSSLRRSPEPSPFAQGMRRPRAAFVRDGTLVALDGNEGRLYDSSSRSLRFLCSFHGPGFEPLAVLPALHLHRFAAVGPHGTLRVYEVPPREGDRSSA